MHGSLGSTIDLSPTPWRRLQLQGDEWTLVDAADYAWLIEHGWNYGSHYKTPWKLYAKRNVGVERSTIYMHREVLTRADPRGIEFEAEHHGDHANGQTLDNRRDNLRWMTPQQNRLHRIPRAEIPTLDQIVAELVAGLPAELCALETMPF